MLRDAFQSAVWMSDYFAIEKMRDKFYQLRLARECGFQVPDTLLTSSRERAEAFYCSEFAVYREAAGDSAPSGR